MSFRLLLFHVKWIFAKKINEKGHVRTIENRGPYVTGAFSVWFALNINANIEIKIVLRSATTAIKYVCLPNICGIIPYVYL
jgi:hypothetical protein